MYSKGNINSLQTYLKATGQDQIKYFVISWPKGNSITPEMAESSEKVLKIIYEFSPFSEEKGLPALSKEFGRIVDTGKIGLEFPSQTGYFQGPEWYFIT